MPFKKQRGQFLTMQVYVSSVNNTEEIGALVVRGIGHNKKNYFIVMLICCHIG